MPPAAGVRPIRAPRGLLSAPGWARPAGSLSACDFHGTASRAWHMIFAGPGSVDRAWHGRRGQPFRSCHGKTVLTQGAGSVRRMPRSPGRGGSRGPAALQGRLRGPAPVAAPSPLGRRVARAVDWQGRRTPRVRPAGIPRPQADKRGPAPGDAGGGRARRAPPRCGAGAGRLGRRRELPGVAVGA